MTVRTQRAGKGARSTGSRSSTSSTRSVSAPRFVGAVRVPSQATLRKYGLDEAAWEAILTKQGGGCGVCGKVPPSGKLQIDHSHVRGWRKLVSQDRHQFVRGIACWHCNSVWLRRGATPERLRAAADYLERYLTLAGVP